MNEFSAIIRHPFSEYWDHEEKFSAWLANENNISYLREATGLDSLTAIECEYEVEGYFVDILARDETFGIDVIVENQFGRSDHDHLGKAQVYSANLDADVIVWIAGEFTQGHLNTIQDHNLSAERDIFALRAEVLNIDGCQSNAFQLVPVAEPSEWPYDDPRVGVYQFHFFEQFVESAQDILPGLSLNNVHDPNSDNPHVYHISLNESLPQNHYKISIRATEQELAAILEIDKTDDHRAFDVLFENRDKIEDSILSQMGPETEVIWERGQDINRDKISVDYGDQEFHPELVNRYEAYHQWLIEVIGLMREQMGPIITQIESQS